MQNPMDGTIDVPGGTLRYRWMPAGQAPVLVFENGWAASHEMWAWIERELAGHASLLFYSRAGIGGSTMTTPQSPTQISDQFAALLDALGIHQPVVLVGHSFGGLICALHAAQQADRVGGLVQIDNTQEVDDALIDKPLKMMGPLTGMAILCARLGIPDPLFSTLSKLLPAEEGTRMQRLAMGAPSSLRAALAELSLLREFRAIIAATPINHPRLVISADRLDAPKGLLRLLAGKSASELVKHLQHVQRLHAAQVKDPDSRWVALPHSHGDLVFTPAGAADTARQIRQRVTGFMHDPPSAA